MYNPVLRIARKELSTLFSEKTLILALLIQLFVASFSSLLIVGLTSLYDPEALRGQTRGNAEIGVLGYQERLVSLMEEEKINIHYYNDLQRALEAFDRGRIDAILTIPDDIDPGGTEIIRLTLYLPESDIKGTFVVMQIKESLSKFESFVREKRSHRIDFTPITLHVEKMPKKSAKYFEFIYTILIPLLVFTPIIISGGLVVDFITEEVERHTIEVLLTAPVSLPQIIAGKITTAVAIVPPQVAAWLFFLDLTNTHVANIPTIVLHSTLIAITIILTGSLIAIEYPNRSTAQYIYSLTLILLFTISYILPDSPLNLTTRLAAGSIDPRETLTHLTLYTTIPIILYLSLHAKITRSNYTLRHHISD